MRPIGSASPERDAATYTEALVEVEQAVWGQCQKIADDLDISTNEVIAIAITELHSRLMNVTEGRLLISVEATDARFYTSSLDAHLAEADPVYKKVLDHLKAGPLGRSD
jgi:hypothetical protein